MAVRTVAAFGAELSQQRRFERELLTAQRGGVRSGVRIGIFWAAQRLGRKGRKGCKGWRGGGRGGGGGELGGLERLGRFVCAGFGVGFLKFIQPDRRTWLWKKRQQNRVGAGSQLPRKNKCGKCGNFRTSNAEAVPRNFACKSTSFGCLIYIHQCNLLALLGLTIQAGREMRH